MESESEKSRMGGGRDLCVVELGEHLGENSVHYSGFGLLGDMLRDQTKEEEKEEEKEKVVLDNRLQKRSQQPTVIEARLPGYKPQPADQKKQDGKFADCGLQSDHLAEEGRWQGDDERRSPIYMEISQQQQVKMNVTRPEEDAGLEAEKSGMKIQVEHSYADSLDLLPLEVEVCSMSDNIQQ